MNDFKALYLQQPDPDRSCAALMLRASKSGRTARQVKTLLRDEGFSGREIAEAADYLSTQHSNERDQ